MKCHVEHDWITRTVKVWLMSDDGRVIYRPGARQILERHEQVPEGATVEPSLSLRPEALEALVREASAVLPASDATTLHLADAIGVRDRLLAMIEQGG